MHANLTPEHIGKLKHALENYGAESLPEWDRFLDMLTPRVLSADEFWIQTGDPCADAVFIYSGILRLFYDTRDGHAFNQDFYLENEVLAPLDGLLSNSPCAYSIQALEKTEVLLFSYERFQKEFVNVYFEWQSFELKFTQRLFLRNARRQAELLLGTAEQRYQWFCKSKPELVERIPQYQLAAYLGITPVSLSRIRKKLKGASIKSV